jgi:hypothetical protein
VRRAIVIVLGGGIIERIVTAAGRRGCEIAGDAVERDLGEARMPGSSLRSR